MEGRLRPAWAVRAIMVIVVTSIFFRCVSATNHTVGGINGWDLTSNLQAWTASSTFRVGDFLVFKYGPNHDVLEVSHLDFAKCRTISPFMAYDGGDSVVELRVAGIKYFICGRRGHCAMGLRLRVQVLPSLAQAPSPQNATTGAASVAAPDTGTDGRGHGSGVSTQGGHQPSPPPPPSTNGEKKSPPPASVVASPRTSWPPPPQGGGGDGDGGRGHGQDHDDDQAQSPRVNEGRSQFGAVWLLGWLPMSLFLGTCFFIYD